MDFYNKHFNSPKLVHCLLIIFLGVLTAPGLADWGRKSPIRNFRGGGKATPLVIIYTPAVKSTLAVNFFCHGKKYGSVKHHT